MWLLLFLLSLTWYYSARARNLTLRTNTPTLLSKSIDYRVAVSVDMTPLYPTWGINYGLHIAPQFRWPWYILYNIHKCRHDLYSTYKQILCHKCRNRTQNRQCWELVVSPNTVIKLLLWGWLDCVFFFCFEAEADEYMRILYL